MPEIKSRKTLFNPDLCRRGIYLLPNLFANALVIALLSYEPSLALL